MLIERIIEFELRGPGHPGCIRTPKLVIFTTKQNSFKEDLPSGLLNIERDNVSYFPLPGSNHLKTLTPKCKILNVLCIELQVKGKLNN